MCISAHEDCDAGRKWGNGLAVRLPAAVVEALKLKEGDDIEIRIAGRRQFDVGRKPGRDALMARFSARSAGAFRPISNLIATRRMPGSLLDSNTGLVIDRALKIVDPFRAA